MGGSFSTAGDSRPELAPNFTHAYDAVSHALIVTLPFGAAPSAITKGAHRVLLRSVAADVFEREFPGATQFVVERVELRHYDSRFPYTLQAAFPGARSQVLHANTSEQVVYELWRATAPVSNATLAYAGWTLESLNATLRPASDEGYVLAPIHGPLRRYAEATLRKEPPPVLSFFDAKNGANEEEYRENVREYAATFAGRVHAALPLADVETWKLSRALADELITCILELARERINLVQAADLGVSLTRFDDHAWDECEAPDVARNVCVSLRVVLFAVASRVAMPRPEC